MGGVRDRIRVHCVELHEWEVFRVKCGDRVGVSME